MNHEPERAGAAGAVDATSLQAPPAPTPSPPPSPFLGFMQRFLLRFLFHFAFVYFVLYCIPFPLNVIPWNELPDRMGGQKIATWMMENVLGPYSQWMDRTVKSFGKWRYGLDITIGPMGSGDTTWNYVQIALFGWISLILAFVWSLFGFLSRIDARLHDWLRLYVRLDLGTAMISYGAFKVVKSQFATPGLDALMRPFGDQSPMGLLWNFMGFSDAYCIFTGVAEVVGGVLLMARRTTTLGALVSAGVMTHIFMLNLCFDTPVKLYSGHLLAMAIFLVLPDARRLCDAFVLHRPVRFVTLRPLLPGRWAHWMAIVLRTALVAACTWRVFKLSWESRSGYGDLAPKPPLYGTWNVEVFESDGELVSEEDVESMHLRWRRLRIGRYRVGIERSDGSTQLFTGRATPKNDRIDLNRQDPTFSASFESELTTPDDLVLEGRFDGHDLHIEFTRSPTTEYFLMDRGFHWINEYPLNR